MSMFHFDSFLSVVNSQESNIHEPECPVSWPLGGLCRYWHRFYAHSEYQQFDSCHVDLEWYRIVRKTPKGCWIDDCGKERFVLDVARRKWAYPTKELALDSWMRRKWKQIGHLERQLRGVKMALELMQTKPE